MNDATTPRLYTPDTATTSPSESTSNDFLSMYNRIRTATNAPTQVQLAAVLHIRQSAISDAKRKRQIPAEWLRLLLMEHNLSPIWICFGVGPRELLSDVADNESFFNCFYPK